VAASRRLNPHNSGCVERRGRGIRRCTGAVGSADNTGNVLRNVCKHFLIFFQVFNVLRILKCYLSAFTSAWHMWSNLPSADTTCLYLLHRTDVYKVGVAVASAVHESIFHVRRSGHIQIPDGTETTDQIHGSYTNRRQMSRSFGEIFRSNSASRKTLALIGLVVIE